MQTWIVGDPRAPKDLNDFLVRFMGKNPYGEPVCRLVFASTVMRKEGGIWTDWPEDASLQERGGMVWNEDGMMEPSSVKPVRTVEEFRMMPKYIDQKTGEATAGWVVEHWFPIHLYQITREQWNKGCATGSTLPIQGPYPSEGCYEAISAPQMILPSITEMEEFVQKFESTRENVKDSLPVRIAKRTYAYEEAHRMKAESKKVQAKLKMKDRMDVIYGTSLAAGRLREELARRAGLTSHVGN